MNDLLGKILVSVGSTISVAALTLLSKSVRQAIFYKRVEYDLSSLRPSGATPFGCRWDIHWEDYRLTMAVEDISDDKIAGVKFEKLSGREQRFERLYPSDKFERLFDGDLFVKINSIVRKSPASGDAEYTLRMVFRRRNRKL